MAQVDSEARLRLVAEATRLRIDAPPIPLPSDSNETWKIGELVLRICWRGDRSRLQREALVLEHLPDEVPHVRLADAGVIDDLTWTLTHWVPGTILSHGWADRDRAQRRTAAEQLGHALRALHAWEPPPEVRAALAARSAQPDTTDVIGADLNPLPSTGRCACSSPPCGSTTSIRTSSTGLASSSSGSDTSIPSPPGPRASSSTATPT